MVERDQLVRVRDARPQLQGTLGQVGGVAVGMELAGSERGLDGGPQSSRLVARGGVVVGDRRALLEPLVVLERGAGLVRDGQ